MASAAVKARLKALRKKYGLGEFKNKRPSGRRGVKPTMARRRFASRRRGSKGGLMRLVKPLIAGAIGDELATQASVQGINVVSHQDKIAGAAAGYFAQRSIKGAILGVAGGMLKDVVLGRNPMASSTGASASLAQQFL